MAEREGSGGGEGDGASDVDPVRPVETCTTPSAIRYRHHGDVARSASAVDDRVRERGCVVADDEQFVARNRSRRSERQGTIRREGRSGKNPRAISGDVDRRGCIGQVRSRVIRPRAFPSAASGTSRRRDDTEAIVRVSAVERPREHRSEFQDERISLGSRRAGLLTELLHRREDERGLPFRRFDAGSGCHNGDRRNPVSIPDLEDLKCMNWIRGDG